MTYRLLRALFRIALRGFFRRVDVQGRESIPASGPVLFIANHTNAFVDPLLLLTSLDRRVTVTAKSTLARDPLLAPLLKAFGAVLLHRRQDAQEGASSADNLGALSECVQRLRAGGAVIIFPEGVSHSDPAMRGFRSGAARIVEAYLKDASAPELSIVPIGLYFTRKDRWRSDAVALVGEPVEARRWSGGGEVDVPGLTAEMRRWVESLTVNFRSAEERDLLLGAGRLLGYRREGPAPLDRPGGVDARAQVALVHRLQRGAHRLRRDSPDRFESLADETGALVRELDALGVEAAEVSLPMQLGRAALFIMRELEILVVGAPLALAGSVLHALPLTVTRRLVRAMSEDEDHPASNAVFLSIPIFTIWWLILDVVTLLTLGLGGLVVVAVAVPFAGLVNLHYRDRGGGVVRRVRTFLLWLRHPEVRTRLEGRMLAWQEQLRAVEAEVTPHHGRDPGAADV